MKEYTTKINVTLPINAAKKYNKILNLLATSAMQVC